MSRNRFDLITQFYRTAVPPIQGSAAQDSEWYPIQHLINSFNANRAVNAIPSSVLVIDETMSAWTGHGLPHLSYLPRKPEPYGCEFKTICDGESRVMLYMELQKGKEPMRALQYARSHGVCAATTIRAAEAMHHILGTGRILVGDSWFASVSVCIELHERGMYFIGNVKVNTNF